MLEALKRGDFMSEDVVEHVEVAVSRLLRYCPSYRTEAPWQAGHLVSFRKITTLEMTDHD